MSRTPSPPPNCDEIADSSPLSSPLSSIGSRSPSLPADYPSPASSNVSETGLSQSQKHPLPEGVVEGDDQPPVKKQKIAKAKEFKTEYLDLSALNESSDETEHKLNDQKLRKLTEVLRSKRKIVVIAGAGISVSAGSTYLSFPKHSPFIDKFSP